MAFKAYTAGRPILDGETRRVRFQVEDNLGADVTPSKLKLVVTDGNTTTYKLSPGSGEEQIQSDTDGHYVDHTFEGEGNAVLKARMEDSGGYVKKTAGSVKVYSEDYVTDVVD